jgi:hypothetical protein
MGLNDPNIQQHTGVLGHYRVSQTVSLLASQAANGTLFSMRWTDATNLCAITALRLGCVQSVLATATIAPAFQLFVARSFTVSDSAGTAITLTGNNQKKRTSHATSIVGDMRFAAVAAGLTVGTRTLDAQPLMELLTVQSITTAPNPTVYEKHLELPSDLNVHPIILAQNEGIIIRGPTVAFGIAGTASLSVDISWAEITAY